MKYRAGDPLSLRPEGCVIRVHVWQASNPEFPR
jgi:hypothetical protein